ncbi:hypothetical protein [Burkholderia sp. LMG 13014]|uniref:hypothetical protein n=1 Tax=Burkholderia TaxID=32008 RepID=UPI0035A99628
MSWRYVSKDPIGLARGNVFQYAPNPVQWIDPLGLNGKPLPGAAGGNSIDNLRLKEPGKSSIQPGFPSCLVVVPAAVQQMTDAFPKTTGLLKAAETVASGTASLLVHAIAAV